MGAGPFLHVHFPAVEPLENQCASELTGENFLKIVQFQDMVQELGLDEQSVGWLHVDDVQLMDRAGNDITDQYRDDEMTPLWGGGKTTAETFLLYVYLGIIALISVVLIQFFLRQD